MPTPGEALAQSRAKPQVGPANARWLAQSMVNPRTMTSRDISPREYDVLRTAYAKSLKRVGTMPRAKRTAIQSAITELSKLPPDTMVTGPDGVLAPASEHLLIQKGLLSKSLQYPDYPPMRTSNGGIDATPIMENLTDPSYSMATSIGRANYKVDNLGNTHVVDTYNFPGKDPSTSLAEKLRHAVVDRRFGMGITEAIGAHFSKDMPVDVQITHGASGRW